VVTRAQNVGVVAGAKDLLVDAAPLRVVDTVNVVLYLHDDAAVLGDCAGEVGVVTDALRLFESQGTILPIARVDLEGVLIGIDIDLDTGPLGREHGDGAVGAPVVVSELATIHEPAVIWRNEGQYKLEDECAILKRNGENLP
jgi:hypothetical protein